VELVFPEALGDGGVIGPFLTIVDVAVGHDVALVARIAGREVAADDFEALTWSYAERSRTLTTTDYVDALEAIRRVEPARSRHGGATTASTYCSPPTMAALRRTDRRGAGRRRRRRAARIACRTRCSPRRST
jgi:hypothetical protein